MLSPAVCVSAGGQASNLPGIWLSETHLHNFFNLSLSYSYRPILIGVDSNGSTNEGGTNNPTGSWDWIFDNIQAQSTITIGRDVVGPRRRATIEEGTLSMASLTIALSAPRAQLPSLTASISSCFRSSGMTSCTTSDNLPATWAGTMNIGLVGASGSLL